MIATRSVKPLAVATTSAAENYYRSLGMTIVGREVRYQGGEADLVVETPGGVTIFVLLNKRHRNVVRPPIIAQERLERLREAVRCWGSYHPVGEVRQDVLSIIGGLDDEQASAIREQIHRNTFGQFVAGPHARATNWLVKIVRDKAGALYCLHILEGVNPHA